MGKEGLHGVGNATIDALMFLCMFFTLLFSLSIHLFLLLTAELYERLGMGQETDKCESTSRPSCWGDHEWAVRGSTSWLSALIRITFFFPFGTHHSRTTDR
jgi:hypothetical protein